MNEIYNSYLEIPKLNVILFRIHFYPNYHLSRNESFIHQIIQTFGFSFGFGSALGPEYANRRQDRRETSAHSNNDAFQKNLM